MLEALALHLFLLSFSVVSKGSHGSLVGWPMRLLSWPYNSKISNRGNSFGGLQAGYASDWKPIRYQPSMETRHMYRYT